MSPQDGQTLGPLIGIGIAMAFLIFRMSTGKARPVNMISMWIIPGLMLIGLVAASIFSRLHAVDYLWLALGLAAGSALGWQRGRLMPIHIDPDTGKPMVKVSPAALIFILLLIVVRVGLKMFVEGNASAWHVNVLFVNDLFLAFAVGFLGVARIEMFIRARRLMAEHEAVAA